MLTYPTWLALWGADLAATMGLIGYAVVLRSPVPLGLVVLLHSWLIAMWAHRVIRERSIQKMPDGWQTSPEQYALAMKYIVEKADRERAKTKQM